MRHTPTLLAAVLALTACPSINDDEETTDASESSPPATTGDPSATDTIDPSATDTDDPSDTDTDDPSDGSDGSDSSDSGGMVGEWEWQELAGPCGGSGTNALWFDDQDVGFVGCGENAAGEGLYTTIDGGDTWEDNVRFNEVRIMDIRRGPDGVLRGAGTHQLDGYSVWNFDESGATIDAEGLYTGSGTISQVQQAENISVTDDGQMLIDSLTGTSAAYAADGTFEELDSLSEDLLMDPDALSFQVRRIVDFDNRFYAVGSLINDPARIHLPSQLAGASYHFHSVELQPDTRDGELLDMHAWSADHIIVVGHDQSERFPLIYLIDGGDPYDVDAWEKIELLDSGIEYQAGINDIHVQGDVVVAAGEKFPTASGGFLVRSEDGGQTWEDITPPEGTGALSRVWLFEDGAMVVAGGSGEMLRYAEL